MPERLVLWDIDGTLVRAGGVARQLFAEAVERVVGRAPGALRVDMGGKTDPQIGLEILASMGLDLTDRHEHLPVVLRHLEDGLAGAVDLMRAQGHVLPGVSEVLARLAPVDGSAPGPVVQTVLTGNTVTNAATKLAAFDLDAALDLEIGAYGSDDADRLRLVPVALDRVARLRGWSFAPEHVWVVGDTPNDLACARAAGVRCVLVGTGTVPVEQLRTLGADVVLDDLGDVDAVVELLRS